jgi:hypothetical protein
MVSWTKIPGYVPVKFAQAGICDSPLRIVDIGFDNIAFMGYKHNVSVSNVVHNPLSLIAENIRIVAAVTLSVWQSY